MPFCLAIAGAALALAPDKQSVPDPCRTCVDPSEEQATIKLRGRLQLDALVAAPGPASSGTEVRRLYLGVEGRLAPALRFQAEADFAGDRIIMQDTYVAYRAAPATEIVAGYAKPPNTADEMTSDVSTLFLERSAFASTFAPGRRTGIAVHHGGAGWGLRAGLFGPRGEGGDDERWLAGARAHADLLPGDLVLHVAISAYRSRLDQDARVSLGQRPETHRAPTLIATGPFPAHRTDFLGGEVGFGTGPLTAQAEAGASCYSGIAADPCFWGWSTQIGWRLTGEDRRYDGGSGLFRRVAPRRPVDAGGPGAIEAGLRVSHVDLDDHGINGGRLTTYGAVLNWYPLTRLRIAGNIIRAERAGADATFVTLRGAIDW